MDILQQSHSEDFLAAYRAQKPAIIWYRVLNDTQTPFSVYVKIKQSQRYSYMLESVLKGGNRNRYTLIGTDPDLLWRCQQNSAEINRNPQDDPADYSPVAETPRQSLEKLLKESKLETPVELPLMASMLVGYLGYDCVRWLEDIPDTNPDTLGMPDGLMMRPQSVIIFDTVTDVMSVVAICYQQTKNPEEALSETRDRLDNLLARIEAPLARDALSNADIATNALIIPDEMQSNLTPAEFQENVRRAKEYIAAGDVFQVVLSQRFSMPFALSGLALFRTLRGSNPSPFLFLLDCDDFSVVGSSPELMVRLRDDTVTIRPIAGTRPRGATIKEDDVLAKDLLNDPKEMAEHLMLLDLGRNDVGRVSQIGTVKATSQFQIELYSHVMHIVSNVEGKIDFQYNRIDALLAGFPAGTVSGAPKIRAMEIIDELETTRRGLYAGCVGYFDGDRNMDNCIALRTAIIKEGTLYVQAGAGVVADSDPEAEHQECVNKSKAIFAAACEAIKRELQPRQG